MAARGKLREALERAKQRKTGALYDSSAPRERPVSARSSTARHVTVEPMPELFARVYADPRQCEEHRILFPAGASGAPGAAAAYRVLRTRVLQRARSNQWTTIGVTSPGAGEGKSVTTLNLALAIAREKNNNVFLIDLDMRNPNVCGYLGVKPPAGIERYFTGEIPPERTLFSIGIPNLAIAGTLERTDQASELLASGRLEELFGYLRAVAPEPLILLDLPPLLSTDDALVVAPKVDACLLVLAEGRSRRDGAAKALELLAEYKLAGIVLNRSSAMVTDYYSSY